MKLKIYLFFFLSLPGILSGQITWDSTQTILNLADKVAILEDPGGNLTIEDVISDQEDLDFKVKGNPILNFGFTTSHYWVKFSLNNPSRSNLILEVAGPHLEKVKLFKVSQDSVDWSAVSGYSIPLNQKSPKHHFQLFTIDDPQGQYLIRMSPPVQPVPLRLFKEDQYEVKWYRQLLVFGLYIGIMVFVILSNIFFFYSLRNYLFLFYAGVVLIYLSYSAFVMDGYVVYFFENLDLQFWYVQIPTFGVIIQLIYAMVFLELKKYSTRVFNISIGIAVYFSIYFFVKFILPDTTVYAINTINAFISFFTMFYIGYVTGKKGNRLGYYFASAYFIYFLLVLTEGAYVQLGTPGYVGELSHVTWATLIEAIILSFLLSKRFEWEKEEAEEAKIEAQKEVVEKTLENEKIIKEQNALLEAKVSERTEELRKSYEDLKKTQQKLIQSEKLASLGELTAGIAHEIKNPLNFVNNFAELGNELMAEVDEYMANEDYEEVKDILSDLKVNLEKINHHGKRADSIVKSMLLHSRSNNGQKEKTNINSLCEEYAKLAYHGFRAKDKSFSANYELKLDKSLPEDTLVSQDFGRVLLNLIGNAFYAVSKKHKSLTDEERLKFTPLVVVKTNLEKIDGADVIKIFIEDNGTGIPESIKYKIFQPFFTTKPAGEGTGLGLSLVYDIINSYQGNIRVHSEEDEGTTFEIMIPLSSLKS